MVLPRAKRARALRKTTTDAEQHLWRALREWPHKARRQHPIGPYVVDIAVPAAKLAIELDGGQHAEAIEADARRTHILQSHGYRVIRFWNNEVLNNLDGVLQTISAELAKPPPHPPLSSPPGGEGAS